MKVQVFHGYNYMKNSVYHYYLNVGSFCGESQFKMKLTEKQLEQLLKDIQKARREIAKEKKRQLRISK